MTFPQLVLETVVGGGPLTDLTTATWTPLATVTSAELLGPTRQRETDRFQPGRQTYRLPNSNRDYDPTNPAGLLTSFAPIRLSSVWPAIYPSSTLFPSPSTYTGGTNPAAVGYVDEETPDWQLLNDDFATIACTDALTYFATKTIIDAGYGQSILADQPLAFWRLADLSGDTVFDDSTGGGRPLSYIKRAYGNGNPPGFGPAILFGGPSAPIVWGVTPNIAVSKDAAVALRGSGLQCPAGTGSFFTGDFKLEMWVDVAFSGSGAQSDLWNYCNATTAPAATYIVSGKILATGFARMTVTDNAGHTLTITGTTLLSGSTPIHLVFEQVGLTLNLYVNGVLDATGTLGTLPAPSGPGLFTLGTTHPDEITLDQQVIFDEVAFYTSLTPAQIATHHTLGSAPWDGDYSGVRINRLLDLLGWPAAMRAIDTGRSLILPPTLDSFSSPLNIADYFQQIAEAEGGRLIIDPRGFVVFHDRSRPLRPPNTVSQATYSDIDPATGRLPPGALPYITGELKGSRSIAEVANEVSITRQATSTADTPVPQVVDDAASQNALKAVKTLTQTGQLNPTDYECNNKARVLLNNRKTPAFRVRSVKLDGRVDDGLWAEIFGRPIGDLVTVMRHPPGGGGPYQAALRVEGKRISVGKRTITSETTCSVADTNDYMTIGHPLGGRLFW